MSNFATEIAKYLHERTQIGDKTGAKLARINLLTKKVVFLHILFVPLHPQIKKTLVGYSHTNKKAMDLKTSGNNKK
jgi:hypothetical protein